MPTNKNALDRYLLLDDKLRGIRRYSLKQLAQSCADNLDIAVSERTISEDLKYMRERFNAPIPKRPEDGLFGYIDRQFSILKSPLLDDEMQKLQDVLTLLKQFEYLPQFQGIQHIMLNLASRGNRPKGDTQPIIAFDRSILRGIDFLANFYDCASKKHPMHVGYRPFSGDDNDEKRFEKTLPFENGDGFSFHFHPYFLKEFNHRWFVFGWNEEQNRLVNYALERFTFVNPLPFRRFIANETIDFSTHFNAIIGVTQPPEGIIETFCLRFQKPRAFYVRTKQWKATQKEVDETDTSITFEWQLMYNRELEARVLEFGQDVEVLTPQWFREKIADIWQNALKLMDNG